MKVHPMGDELFHTDRQTGRRDESNSRFCNFPNAPKNCPCYNFLSVILMTRLGDLVFSVLFHMRYWKEDESLFLCEK
jgi:hypothetical protein